MDIPALREHVFLGTLGLVVLFFLQPAWVGGLVFAWGVVFATRAAFAALARLRPDLLGPGALGKQLSLAGLAVGGITAGLHPVGVVLGLALWPVSLWIWAARHVRHSR